jgi:hypothetical protein
VIAAAQKRFAAFLCEKSMALHHAGASLVSCLGPTVSAAKKNKKLLELKLLASELLCAAKL